MEGAGVLASEDGQVASLGPLARAQGAWTGKCCRETRKDRFVACLDHDGFISEGSKTAFLAC